GATPRWPAVPATGGTDVLIYIDLSRTDVLLQGGTTATYPQDPFMQEITSALSPCRGRHLLLAGRYVSGSNQPARANSGEFGWASRNPMQPLIIDPTLIVATSLPGSDDPHVEGIFAVAVDRSDNCVCG